MVGSSPTTYIHISNLQEHGWTELTTRQTALRLYRELRESFPELCMLGGMGYYGIEEILYLPRHASTLRKRLAQERDDLVRRLAGVSLALQMLEE